MPGASPPAAPGPFSLSPLQESLPGDGCHCKHAPGCRLAPTCMPLAPPGGATLGFSAFGSSPLCVCTHASQCGYVDGGVLPSARRTLDSLPSGRGPAMHFHPHGDRGEGGGPDGGRGGDSDGDGERGDTLSLAQTLGHHRRDAGGGGGGGGGRGGGTSTGAADSTRPRAGTGAASRGTRAPSADAAAPPHAAPQLPPALRNPGPLPNMLGFVPSLGSWPGSTGGPPVPRGSAAAAMPPPPSPPAAAPAHVPAPGAAPARVAYRDARDGSEQHGSQAAAYDAGYAAGYAAAVQAMLDRGADADAAFGGCESAVRRGGYGAEGAKGTKGTKGAADAQGAGGDAPRAAARWELQRPVGAAAVRVATGADPLSRPGAVNARGPALGTQAWPASPLPLTLVSTVGMHGACGRINPLRSPGPTLLGPRVATRHLLALPHQRAHHSLGRLSVVPQPPAHR